MNPRRAFLFLAAALGCAGARTGHAESLVALTTANELVSFESASPETVVVRSILGLQPFEVVLSIDYRPRPPFGKVYAITNAGRLVTIRLATGETAEVGTGLPINPGADYGFDCDPVADRIRVISDIEQNYRLNPVLGTVAFNDTPLNYFVSDPNVGVDPSATGAAFSNNVPGATSTALFVIDSALDILALQNPPSTGSLHTLGGLGVNASAKNGFDISGWTGIAYAVFNVDLPPLTPVLHTIDLATGLATVIGPLGYSATIQGLATGPVGLVEVPIHAAPASLMAVPSVTRGVTRIEFGRSLAQGGTLRIVDVQGRVVRSLAVGAEASAVEWDGADATGQRVGAGLYFARLVSRDRVATTRIAVTP